LGFLFLFFSKILCADANSHLEKFKVHSHRAAVEIILRTKVSDDNS